MPFDSMPQGEPWGEPLTPVCKSCRQPIASHHRREELRFEADPEHRLEELNGAYHAECARPLLSVQRALDMLSRFGA